MESRLWSIVLAADAEQTLSQGREGGPQQFRRPPGTGTLERSLVRLAAICPANRTVIVLTEAQRQQFRELAETPKSVRLVFQPQDRGTAVGVLFGLLRVLTTDPAAWSS